MCIIRLSCIICFIIRLRQHQFINFKGNLKKFEFFYLFYCMDENYAPCNNYLSYKYKFCCLYLILDGICAQNLSAFPQLKVKFLY